MEIKYYAQELAMPEERSVQLIYSTFIPLLFGDTVPDIATLEE